MTVFSLPFEEQEKFFRAKLNIPTRKWTDLWKDQHSKGFMVAGAYKADLLADFRDAVDKAITQGTTLEEFRKDFDQIVAKHGWSYNGSRNWRSEVIYSTNIRTSYAAGRWAQLTDPEQLQVLPYLTYKHGDSRVPRPQHLAWDGLTLPAKDPWWSTHYPPNGWGCKCRVYGSTKKEYEAARAAGKGEAPPSPIDPKTGEPVGIDKGWGYNPGAAANQKYRILESAIERLPDDIAVSLAEEIKGRDREAAKIARAARERSRKQKVDDVSLWKKVGEQKGSNPGGLYEAPDGSRHYVKFYADDAQARTEYAANAIYRMLGVEMPELSLRSWNGKLALTSRWQNDLKRISAAEMAAHPEEMARIFHASVLTKNWDVVGLEYDNVMLGKDGRLVMIDAGGSFKFRAQGGPKTYNAVPDELKTFRDPAVNYQSAAVFNEIFNRNVWLECDGAAPLLSLKKTDVRKVFEKAGFAKEEVKELTNTLWKRREALIDRYDLENKLVPAGFGRHLEEFKKWGREAIADAVKEPNGAVWSKSLRDSFPELISKYERYLEQEFGADAVSRTKALFNGWSSSSNSKEAAVIKEWARERFGPSITAHKHILDTHPDVLRETIADDIRRTVASMGPGATKEGLFSLLDAEYEFHQYYLRRLHQWNNIVLERGFDRPEMREFNSRQKTFRCNAVASCTTKEAMNEPYFGSKPRRVRLTDARVEQVLKTWYQGRPYMHYYQTESEYILIGGRYTAERVK
ncbi:MAG TPA: phage minor head protein [Syntrophales bacterium]|nr:phage minor head protein [Syntrophales bacterium]